MSLSVTQSPFARRLSRHYAVDKADLKRLEEIKSKQITFEAGDDVLRRGAEMKKLILLVSGWAVRCRYTRDGNRQIVHILVPGDVITPNVFAAKRTDHGITALSEVVARFVDVEDMQELLAENGSLAAAFWWATEQEHGMLREQIVRLGRRSALHRIPHLFLELHRRLHLVGQATADSFILPLTQNDIADALGLSNVHVNRTLKKLVDQGYIAYEASVTRVIDFDGLAAMCDFDTLHLHLDRTKSSVEATGGK